MFWDCGDFGDFFGNIWNKTLGFLENGEGVQRTPPLPEGGGVTPLDPLGSFLCS